jgi:hypothetical protein
MWAQYRRRFLWTQLPGALDKLGLTFAAGIVILLLYRVAIILSNLATRMSDSILPLWVLPGAIGVTALTLVAVLYFAAKRPLARLLSTL